MEIQECFSRKSDGCLRYRLFVGVRFLFLSVFHLDSESIGSAVLGNDRPGMSSSVFVESFHPILRKSSTLTGSEPMRAAISFGPALVTI